MNTDGQVVQSLTQQIAINSRNSIRAGTFFKTNLINVCYWRGSKCISNFNITEVPNAPIENLLSTLGDKSSNDILGFDSKLLWLCCDIISPLITKFVNASIITNHVLLDWKVSRVTPVYKGKGTKTDEGNYRPISVIGHVAKLLERVIQKQLMSYLKNNKLISTDQSAYMEHHNTQTALHNVTDDWYYNMTDSVYTGVC